MENIFIYFNFFILIIKNLFIWKTIFGKLFLEKYFIENNFIYISTYFILIIKKLFIWILFLETTYFILIIKNYLFGKYLY